MTKTLTEQWKDGSFKFGVYYCQTKDDGILKLELCHEGDGHGYAYCYGEEECYRYEDIEEVLAPVPSYEEVKDMDDELKELATKNDTLAMENGRLKERLEISTKALKKYQEAINRFKKDPMNNIIMLAHQLIYDIDIDSKKALKEMEGVK